MDNNDLIRRSATAKDLRAYAERKAQVNGIEYANGILAAACRTEQSIPAVDAVEVVHAHWEDGNKSIRNPVGYAFNWWCSHCGKPQHSPVAKNPEEFTKDNPYCHWCGARMDGRRREEGHNVAD